MPGDRDATAVVSWERNRETPILDGSEVAVRPAEQKAVDRFLPSGGEPRAPRDETTNAIAASSDGMRLRTQSRSARRPGSRATLVKTRSRALMSLASAASICSRPSVGGWSQSRTAWISDSTLSSSSAISRRSGWSHRLRMADSTSAEGASGSFRWSRILSLSTTMRIGAPPGAKLRNRSSSLMAFSRSPTPFIGMPLATRRTE